MYATAEFKSVPLSSIIVNRDGRIRRKLDERHIEELADSIRRLGLIHPLVIDRGMVLIAGENRLEAVTALGWSHVPVQFSDTLTERERLSIEMEENIKRRDLDWKDKCDALLRFHTMHESENATWTLSDTAESIGYSVATVSEQLTVARELDAGNEKVLAAPKYSVAKGIATRQQERARADELSALNLLEDVEPISASELLPSPIQVADFLEWAPAYRGLPFNFLHCDFPYGINADGFNQGAAAAFGGYKDTFEHYENLISALVENKDRLLGSSAHVIFWFSMKHYAYTLDRLSQHFWVDPYPLIWHKSDNRGTLPDPQRGPRRVYEVAFLCSHGDRKIISPVSNTFSGPTIRAADHMSEKSEDMLHHFFRMICDGNTRLLDPTAGSGSALRAARRLGVGSLLGLEVNPEYAENARRALDVR